MAEDGAADADAVRRRALRRARLHEVFGDVLPDQTSDDVGADDAGAGGSTDDWLRSQVPPHHGG